MSFFRMTGSLPIAAAITIGLFIAMAALIAQDPKLAPPTETQSINILAKMVETQPRQQVEGLTEFVEAPPPPDTKWEHEAVPGGGGLPNITPERRIDSRGEGPDLRMPRALITFPAPYPESCRARGAQGVVLVEFDVTDRGEVTNARIVSSDDRCFDRTVIKTILGWKFPPEARKGVVQKFVFTLTD